MEAARIEGDDSEEETLEQQLQGKGIQPFQVQSVEADEVRMAVIEAVINAIEHGRSDKGRVQISFSTGSAPARLAVTIGDSGAGFDPARVKAPVISEKIGTTQRKRGWGLKIMRSLMDEVVIDSSDQGTRVTLIKQGKC